MRRIVICRECKQEGETYHQKSALCIECYKANRREYYHKKRQASNGHEGLNSVSSEWLRRPLVAV